MLEFEFKYLPVDGLLPNPLNARFGISKKQILKLADSIRNYGVLHPILVGETSAGLQIIAGEQRWRAAKLAGLEEVPAMLTKVSSVDLLLLFLEENTCRKPLNLLEEAAALQELLDSPNITLENLARQLKRDPEELESLLDLLKLPQKIKQDYLTGKIGDDRLQEVAKQDDVGTYTGGE